MIEGVKIYDPFIHKDERGFLLRLVRKEHVNNATFGDSYVVSGAPGVIRGHHYHKRTTEWFCILKGKGILALKKGDQIDYIDMDAEEPKIVEIPPGIAHAVKNTGDETMLFFAYASERFDPDDDDVYREEIPFE